MKSLSMMTGVVLASWPAPAYAHVGHNAPGTHMLLLHVGVAVCVGGFALRGRSSRSWASWAVLAVGVALIAAAVILPRQSTSMPITNAIVAITKPEDGLSVKAGRPVEVAVDLMNAPLARTPESEAGGHLHLYVDGELQQMPYSMTAKVTLEPGAHEITVEYVDYQHLSFDPPVQQTIEVVAE